MLRRVTAIRGPALDITVSGETLVSIQLLTASANDVDPSGLLIVLLVALAVYLISVWRNPFAPCRWCNGKPKTTGAFFVKAFDLCRHCNGSGRRVRPAARVFPRNYDVK
jgi:hypothetical protein